jgi:hypothetical protein
LFIAECKEGLDWTGRERMRREGRGREREERSEKLWIRSYLLLVEKLQ